MSELRKIQEKELECLIYFKKFCEKNNLLFYLCGGCCIGAIRHKGFIPWDDDIDIFMPRDDYEKLFRLWNRTTDANKRFKLLRTDSVIFTGNIFTTIIDSSTTCIKSEQQHLNIPHGLMMDIFPLDGCPKSNFKRKLQMLHCIIYSLFLSQVIPEKHGKIVTLGSKILLNIFRSPNIREKIWRYCQRKMSKYKISDCEYITELCAGPHYMKNKYPKEIFASAVYKEFEGLQMPLPVGYDKYLRIAFGDYMKMPPISEQKPHHDIIFYDLSRSENQINM